MFKGTGKTEKAQDSRRLEDACWRFTQPLLEQLHRRLDRRLVNTFLDLVLVILMHRNRNNGLLLSELGDQLMGGERGPAGVKRIAKLLHSPKWGSGLILNHLWKQAQERVRELVRQNEAAYVIWDESVLEKSESLKAEGLCAVRSSKAARLKRIKPGYFNPPGGRPIFVPGIHWLPVLAHLCWWTTRGEKASQKREVEGKILKKVQKLWSRQVIHVWDRGFPGSPWTTLALDHDLRFVLRWNTSYHLIGPDGRKHEGWKIARGKRSWEYRMIWDARRRCYRMTGVIALPIHLPEDDRQLFLVVSRPGYGRKPWYLVTTEPFYNADQAWQIETSLRFTKSEMAFESPRLLKWNSRLKFLLIASVAYAFLLSRLHDFQATLDFLTTYFIEQENGAKLPQLHSTVCAWRSLPFGSPFALTPCLY